MSARSRKSRTCINQRRKQCAKCPWRVDVDPNDIPNGYSKKKHEGLISTIATPGVITSQLQIMACHESPLGHEQPCVGWLANQLGPGNNLGLRFAVLQGWISANIELIGEQHERLEDTFPTLSRRRSKKR